VRAVAIVARDLRSSAVAREIEAEIDSGRLQVGRQLPPERELGERFGVSRVTVRSALADLERRGLVDRHPGRGTFVATRRLGESAGSLTSFTELGAQRGLVASARVLDARTVDASIEDSEAFSVAPGADIYELTRVRLLDGMPISIDRTRVPLACLPPLDTLDFARDSLYAALDRVGHGPARADYLVYAVAATAEQAQHLDIAVGSPVLLARTVSCDASGKVVEQGEMAYRGDRYRFQASLVRSR
jgi:GntR family transcriptional regulator